MMRALYRQQGAQMEISILSEKEVQQFIDTHADTLNSSFQKVEMSDAMRSRLERSNWVFSGMKAFHELNEAFPSLIDEEGHRKPFERFLNDVRKVDETYNGNYLRSEYNFVHASAAMAAKWEQFQEDGDRYYLQYRTAGDDRVRAEHAALEGVTLPIDDPFWEEYYPPNGWNCFTGKTPVLTAEGWKHIDSIRRGDIVVGGSGNLRQVTGTHTRTVHDELCCIVTERGSATCTENHRFLTHRGWVSAGSLHPGDIIIQLGKISAKDILIQTVRNAHTLLKKALMPLRTQWESVPPLAIDDKTYRWKKKVSHIGPEKFSYLHFKGHCRNVALHDFFGLAERIAERTHALGMLTARSQRTGYTLCSDIWTKKRAGGLQLICNLANKLAVLLVLPLTYMLSFLCQAVVGCCKAFASCYSSLFRVNPLRADGVTSMPDGDAVAAKDTHHGADVQSPASAEPPHGALLGDVTELGGIPDVHAFDGFHSFYHFIRSTFCHTNYVLVCGKVTYKKKEEQVYNLSVDIDESYIVPIGIAHNCRCTVVQVRKSKYPVTPSDEAMRLGQLATGQDTKGMFHFNPGKQQKAVPDYNPYTISQCRTCPVAKGDGKTTLAAFIPQSDLCQACRYIRSCQAKNEHECLIDEKRERINQAIRIDKESSSLRTGKYYQTKKSYKRGVSHAYNMDELNMYDWIPNNLDRLRFQRLSELGEGKDMSDKRDIANIQKKTDRGVTGYNVYIVNDGSFDWIVKTEILHNRVETVYHVMKKR